MGQALSETYARDPELLRRDVLRCVQSASPGQRVRLDCGRNGRGLMKNEHLIWAYADDADGHGKVIIIGLTDQGLDFLRAGSGLDKKTLLVNPPGKGFANVTQIVFFNEKDKATLKQRLREAGTVVSEVNLKVSVLRVVTKGRCGIRCGDN